MHLLLVRHGESLGNASGVLQGRLDYALSDRGIQQAELTAARLADSGAVRILSSPLTRASATAAFIASSLQIDLRLEPDLAEYDIGEAAGLTGAELRTKFPDILNARAAGQRFRYPGEEGRGNFHERLIRALDSFRELEGPTIAVAHGGVISAFCHIVVGLDLDRPGAFQVGNCSITEITADRAGRLVLSKHNDMCHLEGLETNVDRG